MHPVYKVSLFVCVSWYINWVYCCIGVCVERGVDLFKCVFMYNVKLSGCVGVYVGRGVYLI